MLLAPGAETVPVLRGGGQESGRRAGTEDVAGISAFGAAAKAAMAALNHDLPRLKDLRDRLEEGLRQTPGMIVFSEGMERLPNTTLFTAPGLRAETALIGMRHSEFNASKIDAVHYLQIWIIPEKTGAEAALPASGRQRHA